MFKLPSKTPRNWIKSERIIDPRAYDPLGAAMSARKASHFWRGNASRLVVTQSLHLTGGGN